MKKINPLKVINFILYRFIGGECRPVYIDIDKTLPELRALDDAFQDIQDEFLGLADWSSKSFPIHMISNREYEISDPADNKRMWRVFGLKLMGRMVDRSAAMCPKTVRIIEKVPNVFQAAFSILDPGKSISMHTGPYMGYLRYHLALKVPSENPPVLMVNGLKHIWREGESVLFDDSWPHEVINKSHEQRVVLVVDVLRPLSGVLGALNKFIFWVVKQTVGRLMSRQVKRLYLVDN